MSECSASLTAERPQPVGRLPEGDAAPAPAHHDHDEDGSLPSGESTSLIYRRPHSKDTLRRFTHTSDVIPTPPRRRRVTPSLLATKSASPRPSTTAWGTPGTRGWSSSPTATSTTILPRGRSLPTYHLELVRGKKASFKCFCARIWCRVSVSVVALRPPPLHRGELCLRPD